MSDVYFSWNGVQVERRIDGATPVALAAVGELMVQRLQEATAVPGPEPSAPGEPPHLQTGALHDGITYQLSSDGKTLIFGTTAPEGLFTELGTSRMAPRPWLGSTLDANRGAMSQVLATAMQEAVASGSTAAPTSTGTQALTSRVVGKVLGAVAGLRQAAVAAGHVAGNLASGFWRVRRA